MFWRLRAPHDSGGEDGGQVPWFPMAPVSSGPFPNLVAFIVPTCLCTVQEVHRLTLFLRYAGATMSKSVFQQKLHTFAL